MTQQTAAATSTSAITAETLADSLMAGETTMDKLKERVRAGKLDFDTLLDAQTIVGERNTAAAASRSASASAKVVRISAPKSTDKGEVKGGSIGVYGFARGFPVMQGYSEAWLHTVEHLLVDAMHLIETSPHVTAKTATVADLRERAKVLRGRLESAGFKRSGAAS